MEFTFGDAEELWALVSGQESLVDKKRRSAQLLLPGRWLESMILKPNGCSSRAKRPKFLSDA
nr:unnamed protein product [Digitaria exilis]